MEETSVKKGYPVIDFLRVIAAIFVIAIHIYPFASISPFLDFICTRVVGRIAVPFFFMVISFFLFQYGYPTYKHIKKTILSLLKWYGYAIMIYIPLMLYNHYFTQPHLYLEVIKDLFIDGTFYHLWYFPAVIVGLIIVLLLKKGLVLLAWGIVVILYIVGLMGDSYYGMIVHIPALQTFYDYLFVYMDYTRNGLFFAPMFLMLGSVISEEYSIHQKTFIFTGCISFVCMFIESLLLHTMTSIRHDAMYVFLPVVCFCLFYLCIQYQGNRHPLCQKLSLYVYIFHPLMIVVVRMIGKFTHLMVFVDNNFIQFLLVVCGSFGVAYMIVYLLERKNGYGRKV